MNTASIHRTPWACLPLLLWVLGCLLPGWATAGPLSCAIASVSGISLTYSPASPTALVGSGSVTINCTKSGTNSDTRYLELAAGPGLNAAGAQNRAANGTSMLSYGLWRDASATAAWGDTTSTRISSTVSSTTSTSITLNWWMVVPPRQSVLAGTYLDTVTLKLYQGVAANPALSDPNPAIASLSIALTVVSQCSLSSPPGALQFSYTSFQTIVAVASTSFAVTCTNGWPYTATLDASSGTLLGLNYQLSLSASGTQTGTGLPQSMAINGTMPAGQSGTCAAALCTASDIRTLTITY